MESQYCVMCTLPAAYPGSRLDDGVCIFCRSAGAGPRGSDGQAIDRARAEMRALFDKIRDRSWFDCVVCYSGGKDSTYVLRQVVQAYGLRPLALTIDNGFITSVSRQNMERVTSALGVEHHSIKINQEFMKKMARASLFEDLPYGNEYKRLSAVCSSCIFLVNTTAIRYALQYDAALIIAGFTAGQAPAAVYGSTRTALDGSRERRLERMERCLGKGARSYFAVDEKRLREVAPYPIHVNPLLAEPYSEQRILTSIRELGWELPPDTGKCSTNCSLNCLGTYAHFQKHGFNPYAREIADLVRSNALSYERGMEMILDVGFDDNVRTCLQRLDISQDELLSAMHMARGK